MEGSHGCSGPLFLPNIPLGCHLLMRTPKEGSGRNILGE